MESVQKWNLAIVGATGQVGQELYAVLKSSGFPNSSIRLLASRDSEGERTEDDERIGAFQKGCLAGIELVFLAVPSHAVAPCLSEAREQSCHVIDLSSTSGPTWLVPGVNSDDEEVWEGQWLGNPFPEVTALSLVVDAIRGVEIPAAVEAQIYLSASDRGRKGVEELASQTINLLNQKDVPEEIFGERLAFNLLPGAEGDSEREGAAAAQVKAILNEPDLQVGVEFIRVPVFTGTTIRTRIQLEKPAEADAIEEVLREQSGLDVWDSDGESTIPRVSDIPEVDDIRVGGLKRVDERTVSLWITLDNLRRGAALNALQIAAQLVQAKAN